MMLTIAQALKDHGLSDAQIKFELFASGQPGRVARKAMESEVAANTRMTKLTVQLDGSRQVLEMDQNTSVLDAAVESGLDVPFACKAGVCSTCLCRVLEGEVEMQANHALEDHEVKDGFVLSCQSFPLTDTVVVDYDRGH
jgi:ring-1,2-phenylacetyl-CoA epoxidase subunit PaaE